MPNFKAITSSDPIKEIIKSAFDLEVELSGGWGYSAKNATYIHSTNGLPASQFEHTLATMRAYIEMNMTLSEDERYGSINPNETSREIITVDGIEYEKVIYTVTGMKEDRYADFINEYKKGYGTPTFDMDDHFKRRKEATISRVVEHWFLIDNV